MSKAGQNTHTGISDQADIALLNMLTSYRRPEFQKVIIEGKDWDDFTLIFNGYTENYEVKSYVKPISFSDIKKIIEKRIKKQYGEKDKFKIVVRKLSSDFKKCYEYIHDNYSWIIINKKNEGRCLKKLKRKNWHDDEIACLSRTEILEFDGIENVHKQIEEYFAFEYPIYLSDLSQSAIISKFFREILEKGKTGGFITKDDINKALEEFSKEIVSSPTSFSPEVTISSKIEKIDSIINDNRLQELDNGTILSQLTHKYGYRLIFYLCEKLEKSDYKVDQFKFFINKVLIKQNFIRLALKLLESKLKLKKVSIDYVLTFIFNNYNKMSFDLNYDDALRLVNEIVDNDKTNKYYDRIIEFLKKDILVTFYEIKRYRIRGDKRGWREDEQVAKILHALLKKATNKRYFIDFIFDYFDFTSDDFDNTYDTHPIIYSFVKDFIKKNLNCNMKYIISKVTKQYSFQYANKYVGYEWIGSGMSQVGSNYSISDKGVVKLIFKPLFAELYKKDKRKYWRYFKKEFLDKEKIGASKIVPLYLKRSLIPIIFNRITDEAPVTSKPESFGYLKNILKIEKGIPQTSEVIFSEINKQELVKIGYDRIMELINIDSVKYKRKNYNAGYPTNLFVVAVLVKLISYGFDPAKKYFLSIAKKPDFTKYDSRYDTFEQLVSAGVPEKDPDFIFDLIKIVKFENYLKSIDERDIYDKGGVITGLVKKCWTSGSNKGEELIKLFLSRKNPNKNILELLSGPVRDLGQYDPIKTFEMLKPYLINKKIYWSKFKNSHNIRESIVYLSEYLVAKKEYTKAKIIIELSLIDPDPNTDDQKDDFNYHKKIKQGMDASIITSVRGKLAWVLQKLVVTNEPKEMEYAFKKTVILLDLNGKLARKLGYSEPDLYVRKQALVPLTELANYSRRNALNIYKSGLGDKVKAVALQVIDNTQKNTTSPDGGPKDLIKHLLVLFSNIRDLTTSEAKDIIRFFDMYQMEESRFLYVYFAIYREKQFKKIHFNAKYFKKKLMDICRSVNKISHSIAWEFWIIIQDDKKDKTNNYRKLVKYWKLLFENYDQRTWEFLYRTLELTLQDKTKYKESIQLLKKALSKEFEYYRQNPIQKQSWEPGPEIFQVIAIKNKNDFLEILYFVVSNINDKIGFPWMRELATIFTSTKAKSKKQIILYSKINTRINELYPDLLKQ